MEYSKSYPEREMLWSGGIAGRSRGLDLSNWSVHFLASSPALERTNVGERMGIASSKGEKLTIHAKIE